MTSLIGGFLVGERCFVCDSANPPVQVAHEISVLTL